MESSELIKAAQAAATIKRVIGRDFQCSTREAFDGEYGKNSILILFHKDHVLNSYVNYDAGQYDKIEELAETLHEAGFWVEDCNGSYSAVYAVCDLEATGSLCGENK